ncbi:hypothetical protein H5410_003621 [Solanum commersonii]|uniref:F-box domain-containing protein n=1 Tax=Solanum commersonii TaxID=4109 RepID=A0A9J6B5I5_SOLCO|nr:hypothetical protein H5410_003621 [Solanum commersonii]
MMAGETLDDRMSELPESLVLQILSLLPTEEAFTTCILSKRWQYLWTSLNSFIFSPKRYWERSKGFRSFVDYVFSLYKHKSQISRWLTFAVKKNVQHVVIYSHPPYIMPRTFFTCSSLITLHIAKCSLVSDIVIAWNLKLEGYWMEDDGSENDSSFEIFALNLQLSHDFHDFNCRHVDVSSVVNAKDKSDQDSDDDEEDSYGDDHQYSDDEEESCSDYFQDSDDDQDSYSDYYEDSDDMEEDNHDEDSDDTEED